MNTANFRRLLLESTEERITPSRGAELPQPRPDAIVVLRDQSHDAASPDRSDSQPRPEAIGVFRVPLEMTRADVPVPQFHAIETSLSPIERDVPEAFHPRPDDPSAFNFFNLMRSFAESRAAQGDGVSTEEKIAAPPAPLLRDVGFVAPASRPAATAAPTGRTLAVALNDAEPNTPSSAPPAVAPTTPVAAELRIPTPLADRPIAPTGGDAAWPLQFVGTDLEAAGAKPSGRETKADPPAAPATPSEEPAKSAGTLVERAIEAILPSGVPLHGVLPLAEEWVELGANGLLSQLQSLDQDANGDMPLWEQATWIAGAVLVFGGVTYTVGVNRGRRRLDRVVIGTDSALARWEDQNGRAKFG